MSDSPKHQSEPPDSLKNPSRVDLGEKSWIEQADLNWRFSRSSGPGGQSVNKLNTKAELRILIASIHELDEAAIARLRKLAGRRITTEDELILVCDTSRSQITNRQETLNRLKELVAEAEIKPKVRRKKKPTKAMKEKRMDRKKMTAEKKSRRQWRDGEG